MPPPIGGSKPPSDSNSNPNTRTAPKKARKYRLMDYRTRESPAEEEARREREARKPFWKQRRAPAPVKEGKPAALYVPVNYDLADLREDWRWPTACYLNFIHWGNACWRADEFGYVRLKYQYLNRVIPDGLIRPIRKSLEADGVIEVDTELRPSRCFGHKLTEGYRQASRIVCTDAKMNRRIWRVMQTDKQSFLLRLALPSKAAPRRVAALRCWHCDCTFEVTTDGTPTPVRCPSCKAGLGFVNPNPVCPADHDS
jgi:hypothetical protein